MICAIGIVWRRWGRRSELHSTVREARRDFWETSTAQVDTRSSSTRCVGTSSHRRWRASSRSLSSCRRILPAAAQLDPLPNTSRACRSLLAAPPTDHSNRVVGLSFMIVPRPVRARRSTSFSTTKASYPPYVRQRHSDQAQWRLGARSPRTLTDCRRRVRGVCVAAGPRRRRHSDYVRPVTEFLSARYRGAYTAEAGAGVHPAEALETFICMHVVATGCASPVVPLNYCCRCLARSDRAWSAGGGGGCLCQLPRVVATTGRSHALPLGVRYETCGEATWTGGADRLGASRRGCVRYPT